MRHKYSAMESAMNRHNFLRSLAVTWVRENHPETFEQLRAIAHKKYPLTSKRSQKLRELVNRVTG